MVGSRSVAMRNMNCKIVKRFSATAPGFEMGHVIFGIPGYPKTTRLRMVSSEGASSDAHVLVHGWKQVFDVCRTEVVE